MNTQDAIRALNTPLPENDAGAADVRAYLKELLFTVLCEEESFSGKRPFGNSGWWHELTGPLREAGFEWQSEEKLFDALVAAL